MYPRLIHTKYLYKPWNFNYKVIILRNNRLILASMFEYGYIEIDI